MKNNFSTWLNAKTAHVKNFKSVLEENFAFTDRVVVGYSSELFKSRICMPLPPSTA